MATTSGWFPMNNPILNDSSSVGCVCPHRKSTDSSAGWSFPSRRRPSLFHTNISDMEPSGVGPNMALPRNKPRRGGGRRRAWQIVQPRDTDCGIGQAFLGTPLVFFLGTVLGQRAGNAQQVTRVHLPLVVAELAEHNLGPLRRPCCGVRMAAGNASGSWGKVEQRDGLTCAIVQVSCGLERHAELPDRVGGTTGIPIQAGECDVRPRPHQPSEVTQPIEDQDRLVQVCSGLP
jgi:hypothetical protein